MNVIWSHRATRKGVRAICKLTRYIALTQNVLNYWMFYLIAACEIAVTGDWFLYVWLRLRNSMFLVFSLYVWELWTPRLIYIGIQITHMSAIHTSLGGCLVHQICLADWKISLLKMTYVNMFYFPPLIPANCKTNPLSD